jgi:hypothetical protein
MSRKPAARAREHTDRTFDLPEPRRLAIQNNMVNQRIEAIVSDFMTPG